MGGDFNEIRFIGKRRGEAMVVRFIRVFSKFVDKFAMVDLRMCGNDFTWSRGEVNPSMSRIGRFLIYSKWEEAFPKYFKGRGT